MNGSTGNTAAFERPDRGDTLLSLTTARRMVALVRQIVEEIVHLQRRLAQLYPEQERLDQQRRTLSWPERSRRYQLQEEIAAGEHQLEQSRAELDSLNVVLIHAEVGWVGFPTKVNGRSAFFCWKPGDEELRYWHFAGESVRRLIPASWAHVDDASLTGKR
jgi:hypothetical protein